jgi:hypothetical protein
MDVVLIPSGGPIVGPQWHDVHHLPCLILRRARCRGPTASSPNVRPRGVRKEAIATEDSDKITPVAEPCAWWWTTPQRKWAPMQPAIDHIDLECSKDGQFGY